MCLNVRRPDFANLTRSPQQTKGREVFFFEAGAERADGIFTFGGGLQTRYYSFSRECSPGGPPDKNQVASMPVNFVHARFQG